MNASSGAPARIVFSALLSLSFSLPTSACGNDFVVGTSTYDAGASSGNSPSTPVFETGCYGASAGSCPDGSAGGEDGTLTFILRDFKVYSPADATTNPDFENTPKTDAAGNPDPDYAGGWDDRGVVAETLGADRKPVYASAGTTLTTHGAGPFSQWFNDVPGVNVRVEIPFVLDAKGDGSFGYDSQVSGVPLSPTEPARQFFPLDDDGAFATPVGNQGFPHNYSFTCEAHSVFTYQGGEFFRYRGDDDVWVFVDGRRVIDLGGIHDPEEAEVALDSLGLTKGRQYPLDFFFAERHVRGSNVLFTTSLRLRAVPK